MPALKKKYDDLVPELAAQVQSYQELTESASPALITRWQKQMDSAHRRRATDVAVMDAFDVELAKGTCENHALCGVALNVAPHSADQSGHPARACE